MSEEKYRKPSRPEGFITKKEAAKLIGRNTKTVERICRASLSSPHKVRWMYMVNPGTRSIVIYQRDDLLRYMEYRHVTEAKIDVEQPVGDPVAKTMRAMQDLVQRELGRGAESVRVELSTAGGGGRLRVSVEWDRAANSGSV